MHTNKPNHIRQRVILLTLFAVLWAMLLFYPAMASADCPHPSKNYKWSLLPAGLVVLYFLEDGQYTQCIYQMSAPVERATACAPKYDNDTFRLVTFDTTQPYYYTMNSEPIRQRKVAVMEDTSGAYGR